MNPLRRKLAIATWSAPREGNIYGKLDLDVEEVLAYVAWLRERSGEKVTLTHFVGKCVAQALAKSPGLNGVIRLGTYVPRQTVDVAYLVALEEGKNLAKAKICDFDKKSVVDVAVELRQLAEKLYSGNDESFNKSMGPLKFLPTWIIRPLTKVVGYLTGVWGVNIPALGLEAYPFGTCLITNVGVFGLDEGYAPPTPYAHTPLLVLIGAVRDAVVPRDGEIVVRKMLTITATIDHRYMDGAQGAVLAREVRSLFANPWQLEGMDGRPEN
ncbi:MAG: 2-oxo acid dehydrogenase subunit E2 [Myxococcales bacterium]|nr:2-oxo acid dehydrogenase subunit E2 [Myxococcales bacterium]